MKKNQTRRALLMSALSLLLCVSMLVGTTFAWFTDSVTSGQNTIAAGNLDVELYYTASVDVAADPDSNAWVKVDSNTDVFGYDNWEPGFTKVVYFKIVNEGSLALKYKLAADVYSEKPGTNKAGAEFNLSDHLYTAVVPVGSTRDQILAMNGTKLNANFAMGNGSLVAKANENGTDKATAVVGLAIWMPTTVDNTANHNGNAPEIVFGINLLATQYTSEEDSFDANYDQDARYPAISLPGTLPETGNTDPVEDMLLKTMDGVSTKIPADLVADIGDEYTNAKQLHLKHTEPIFDAAAKTVSFGNIDIVDENGNVIELEAMNNTVPITVVVPVGDTFAVGETVIIYHDGEPVASAVVDADKNVTYTVAHFCEVVVSAGDGKIDSAVEFAAALAQGGDITLANDITVDKPLEIPAGVTVNLNLNGYTITSENSNVIKNYGTLTITNGVLDATTAYTVNNAGGNVTIKNVKSVDAGFYNAGTMLVEDCEITNTISGRHGLYNNANATLVINGLVCSTTSQNAIIYNNNGEVTVNDGAFTQIGSSYMLDGSNITINGGTFTDDDGKWAIRGNGHVIKGGTFNFNPNNYVAPDYKVIDNGDGTFTVGSDKTSVATAAELNEALAQGGKIALTADITTTETIAVSQEVEVILDLGGHTLAGQVDKLLELKDGNVTIQNGTIRNVHEAATDTKYSIYMSGDAKAEIKNVTIETTGIGVYMTDNAHITELNANISSYITVSGRCSFDAVSLEGNAKIDAITGGKYEAYYTEAFVALKPAGQPTSYVSSFALRLNSADASVGTISDGTFRSTADSGNMGAALYVNNGTVECISGGYFGYMPMNLNNVDNSIYVNLNNGGKINAITGGTFEKGAWSTGFRWDFEGLVNASGCAVADTGETAQVQVQWSKKVDTHNLVILEVVAQ